MKRYRMADGATFSAETPEELIQKMREKSFTDSVDVESFMQQTAKRSAIQSSKHVRTDSAANFVADLMTAELLTEVDGTPRCDKCNQVLLRNSAFMQPQACDLCGCVQNPPEGNGKANLTNV